MTLNFYSLNGDGTSGNPYLVGDLLAGKTQTFFIPGGDPTSPNSWVTRPYFDLLFDLSALNLTLPDKLAYGLEFNANQNSTANSLNIGLWNYGTFPGYSTTDADFDASVIKTGTDLVSTWGRRYDGGAGYFGNLVTQESLYEGQFTPSIAITAVPEPSTYCMALGGLACGGYLVRRCRKQA